ncbi:P-loop containing nucleoside triphosphate hydrolase protein [Kockovaella imperatae]|uniref:p-loop containing nucleoside triphosphate hydrolase protein n=1 Tax=Kockovaella imperatae TaxID=4999 RepID=A0A1Y1UNU5_9TREE|nr:P-loop containing nucleoside triphosphate hydrolase protein [Kockovaella imperatae]ORX39720.1 P-loop containing nucleoside triphosphate hydrolase protein [Kockovaella imperatae]
MSLQDFSSSRTRVDLTNHRSGPSTPRRSPSSIARNTQLPSSTSSSNPRTPRQGYSSGTSTYGRGQNLSAPPSSYRLQDSVELHAISRPGRQSPFDDRYAIDHEPYLRTDPSGEDAMPPPTPLQPPLAPQSPPLTPTFRGLFSLHTPRDHFLYLVPAVLVSMTAALVQPYMSVIVGDAFEAFVNYPLDNNASEAQREALRHDVKLTTVKLAIAGAAAVALNYVKGVLWARHGENVTHRLRHAVYASVRDKPIEWFDLGMGMPGESIGAGGLMAKFTRETDEVRLGSSIALGLVVQNLSTFIACFILALATQPVLALVTLSTIPVIVIIQFITQIVCQPLYALERRSNAEASTNVDRATSAIATVKAHNAQGSELERFTRVADGARASLIRQSAVWALSISTTEFFLLGTFVVGFWYGAKVVRDGTSAGTVMTVFWACLLSATFLQMVVPQLTVVTKGKNSMASLRTVITSVAAKPAIISNPFVEHDLTSSSAQAKTDIFSDPGTSQAPPSSPGSRVRGDFTLSSVTFAYPSRPEVVILKNVTLFLPPGETTFIVGGSGSGKSTIAQLLLGLYDPNGGLITMDNRTLSPELTRQHIGAVQQGCILFDMSVHDNVAIGSPSGATRAQVIEACKMALIHEFIEGLPEGYETNLGTGGSALSGGQRQRLAIARARIRNPTVLILDEATSALDATSRVLVFENIKTWRKNQTTIVITHDLSQIVPDDFVYVMRHGVVAEQGFRSDLVKKTPLNGAVTGIFAAMAAEQALEPLAEKMEDWDPEEVLEDAYDAYEVPFRPHTPSFGLPGRESMAYFDVLEQYAKTDSKRLSRLSWEDPKASHRTSLVRRSSLVSRASRNSLVVPRPASQMSFTSNRSEHGRSPGQRYSQLVEKEPIQLHVSTDDKGETLEEVTPVKPTRPPGLFALLVSYFPTLPRKQNLFFGLFGAILHGVATPIWSFFLSKLMTIVGSGGTDPALTKFGLIVLAICAAQAFADWLQQYFLYSLAAMWVNKIRSEAYGKVLAQDKAWFDQTDHSPVRLVQSIIKDSDDMRALIASVIGKMTVFVIMVGMGIIWAMIVDWRLTLIGVGLAPVFASIMTFNNSLIGKAEVRNKAKREAVARTFYECVANLRGIRAMALEKTFNARFEADASSALSTGKRTGWAVAIGIGFVAGMPFFAQALMNWAGSVFILQGYINYAQMLQVYNLILFSLTMGTAMLDFIPAMAKGRAAATDFNRLYYLSTTTSECAGSLRFPIPGQATFSHVSFAYPTRPDVPILSDLSLSLHPGEAVAIVGPSGCGKSTIAALLQKLYEPSSGTIHLDKYDLAQADVKWLRNHIAIVSQTANLFDATVAENIAYGSNVPIGEIQRAARAANIHDFIQGLPGGYDTNLGENASLISGGQAQRLQIARALVRRSRILILDECTSALDGENERAILDTIGRVKETRTTIFITHSLEAMKRCDRVICLVGGRVVEEGPFEQLLRRGGVFAQLMQTGEWE